jgi:Cyclin, C-terminal domain
LSRSSKTSKPSSDQAFNMRKYAEFFTDFCIQENDLIKESAHTITCAVLALTRKHLNCEVIWPYEMELVTFCSFAQFKQTYREIERRYGESFPKHAES